MGFIENTIHGEYIKKIKKLEEINAGLSNNIEVILLQNQQLQEALTKRIRRKKDGSRKS